MYRGRDVEIHATEAERRASALVSGLTRVAVATDTTKDSDNTPSCSPEADLEALFVVLFSDGGHLLLNPMLYLDLT
jgi:hypothetical protein